MSSNAALNQLTGRILTGDCLDLLPSVPDHSIDMVLTDLPYGTTRNAWDSVIDLEALWAQLLRVTTANAAIVMTAQAPFTAVLAMSQLPLFKYEWVWEKTNASGHLNAKRQPMKAHENVLVFYRKQPVYNPQKTAGHPRKVSSVEHKRNSKLSTNYGDYQASGYDSTERYPRSVQVFAKDVQKSKLHATQKPVALFEYLIRTYTNPGQTVLDVCVGSGTTAVAARNLDRRFIAMEKDEQMAATAQARLDA